MSDEPIDKTNHEPADEIRHAFEHLGGKYVGRIVPVQTEKEISFEHLGGKCVLKPSDHPMYKRAKSVESEQPEESVEKENEGRTGNEA
jgi:hypothetical protein